MRARTSIVTAVATLVAGLGVSAPSTADAPSPLDRGWSEPTPTASATASSARDSAGRPILTSHGWKQALRFYRQIADLSRLRVVDGWSDGAWRHSRYMVKNGIIEHRESSSKPWYSAAGDAAARNGNLSLVRGAPEKLTGRAWIERWMRAPFHAAAIIDPRLTQTGFGVYRERRQGLYSQGATLDVLRGHSRGRGNRVVTWPANGMQVPLKTYSGSEWPDPLTSCRGYGDDEVGLPVLALFPRDVRIAETSFTSEGRGLEHCAFDRSSYRNPKRATQRYGRDLLADRNAVVIIPKAPLQDLRGYAVTIKTTDGETVHWRFTVGEVEPPVNVRISGTAASRAFQDRTSFGVGWLADDPGGSGAAFFDVRWRRAPVGGRLGTFERWLTGATGAGLEFDGQPGYTYCFSARATDRAGNRSRWGKETCTTMPIRAMDLTPRSTWLPLLGPDFYAERASLSLSPGAVLKTQSVLASRVALIATSMPLGGEVDVHWNGEHLGRVTLSGSTIRSRRQIEFEPFGRVERGVLKVTVVGDDPVIIEGLGVARR